LANTVVQIKRTAVSGRSANSTTLVNAGELALNMTDGILFSTNGSNIFAIGGNNTTVNIYSGAYLGSSANLNFASGSKLIDSTGSQGIAGQVLTSNGAGNVYWAAAAAGSVNVDAQYTWTNTQTFQNTITFSSNLYGNFINATTVNATTITANTTGIHTGNVSATVINASANVFTNTVYATNGNFTSLNATANLIVGTINASSNGVLVSNTVIQIGNTSVYSNVTPGVILATSNIAIPSTANLTIASGGKIIDSTGSQGTAGQLLTSNGTGNVYWSTVTTNVNAQYTWTNTQTFSNTITFSANINLSNTTIVDPVFQSYREYRVQSTVTSTAVTLDLSTSNFFDLTLSNATITATFSNPPASGNAFSFTVIARQDATGSRVITWPAAVKWPNGSVPTQTTVASHSDVFNFITVNGGSSYFGGLAMGNTTA
jgi:hypothetical protein